MGTPPFAAKALEAMIEKGYNIRAVFTQPPKPAGRGMKTQISAVQKVGEMVGLPVHTPHKWDAHAIEILQEAAVDLVIVAAYGFLLPSTVLSLPPLGCVNIHASLLPRWRGAAPIPKAILEGDLETGITLMYMNTGMDTGDMIAQKPIAISATATGGGLYTELSEVGATLLLETLPLLFDGKAKRYPQPNTGITYAPKINAQDFAIDWTRPADWIERQVRAYHPKVHFYTRDQRRFRLLKCSISSTTSHAPPGTILNNTPDVSCGDGALTLLEIQPDGRPIMDAKNAKNGYLYFASGQKLN